MIIMTSRLTEFHNHTYVPMFFNSHFNNLSILFGTCKVNNLTNYPPICHGDIFTHFYFNILFHDYSHTLKSFLLVTLWQQKYT